MAELTFHDIFNLFSSTQIPEQFGPIRTVAEGKGDVILIGTTRNFVLQGTLSGDFAPITQVRSGPAGPPHFPYCQNITKRDEEDDIPFFRPT